MTYCPPTGLVTRRRFWSTQPTACGSSTDACSTCDRAGMAIQKVGEDSATISTDDWVRGIILNKLGTKGRNTAGTNCLTPVGYRGGHWSDSFRKDGFTSGATAHFVPPKSSFSIQIAAIASSIESDLAFLLKAGIVRTVKVVASYLGGNKMIATISYVDVSGLDRSFSITGAKVGTSWSWT